MKLKISDFIEKHNSHIQIIFFITILIIGLVFPIFDEIDKDDIIITILTLISFEILFLIFYNDKFQDKIYNAFFNKLKDPNMISINIDGGYKIFSKLLSQVDKDLFISGVTCSSVMSYISEFEELLKKNCSINILVSSTAGIESNTLIGMGKTINDESENNKILKYMYSQSDILFDKLMAFELTKNAIMEEKIKIRVTQIPFTVSYVGINIFSNNNNKQLKVTQYIPGCEIGNCPCILINSINNSELYNFYEKYLKESWNNAKPIEFMT